FLALARRARDGSVSPGEEAAFRAVNGLGAVWQLPIWTVMQGGNLAAAGVAAAAAYPRSKRMAAGLAGSGAGAWALANVAKRFVRRGRPAQHLRDVRVRGTAQRGLGFPSGHAA